MAMAGLLMKKATGPKKLNIASAVAKISNINMLGPAKPKEKKTALGEALSADEVRHDP